MHFKTVSIRQGNKLYKYLRLVESYREGCKIKQRVIANLGNLENMQQEKIDSLISGLYRYTSKKEPSLSNLEANYAKNYGDILAIKKIWDDLEIGKYISRYTDNKRTNFNISSAIFIMVANRLISPKAKISLTRWYKDKVFIVGSENVNYSYQNFYRSMDYLIDIKETLEVDIYGSLINLFNFKLNLVFYDLTSTYFEGDGPDEARYGYSRDRRSDRKQILLGLCVTSDGIPIASEVFSGNVADKSTLSDTVSSLQERFDIDKVIFVCDRGMISAKNIKTLKDNYDYIIAVKKREISATEGLTYNNLASFTKTDYDGLLAKEVTIDGTRYIICHNIEKAADDRTYREGVISKVESDFEDIKLKNIEKIKVKVAEILYKRKAKKYFRLDFSSGFKYSLNEKNIKKEEALDGKFILTTNKMDMPTSSVISSYKTLSKVEAAFREIKDFIKIRPIYHYTKKRVRAHVFICVLSYLVEAIMEKKLARLSITTRSALDKLSDIKIVENILSNHRIRCVTKINRERKKILGALGISNITRTIL